MGAAVLQRRGLAAWARVGNLPTVVAAAKLSERWLDLDLLQPASAAL